MNMWLFVLGFNRKTLYTLVFLSYIYIFRIYMIYMDQFEGPEHTRKSENSEPNNSDFLKRGWMVGTKTTFP